MPHTQNEKEGELRDEFDAVFWYLNEKELPPHLGRTKEIADWWLEKLALSRQEGREEERERILRSVNDKEKQEQILGTLLHKIIGGEGEFEVSDVEIISNDWVVFEIRDPQTLSTKYKLKRNAALSPEE